MKHITIRYTLVTRKCTYPSSVASKGNLSFYSLSISFKTPSDDTMNHGTTKHGLVTKNSHSSMYTKYIEIDVL